MTREFSMTVNFGRKEWQRYDFGRRDAARCGSRSRKTMPFLLTIAGLSEQEASDAFVEWAVESARNGAPAMGDSDFDVTWFEDGGVMEVKVSYPKDFDSASDVETQRVRIRSAMRSAAATVSCA